jgi:hypothetical protein
MPCVRVQAMKRRNIDYDQAEEPQHSGSVRGWHGHFNLSSGRGAQPLPCFALLLPPPQELMERLHTLLDILANPTSETILDAITELRKMLSHGTRAVHRREREEEGRLGLRSVLGPFSWLLWSVWNGMPPPVTASGAPVQEVCDLGGVPLLVNLLQLHDHPDIQASAVRLLCLGCSDLGAIVAKLPAVAMARTSLRPRGASPTSPPAAESRRTPSLWPMPFPSWFNSSAAETAM